MSFQTSFRFVEFSYELLTIDIDQS